MIKRPFYRHEELSSILGVDAETVRQAVANGVLVAWLEFSRQHAKWRPDDPILDGGELIYDDDVAPDSETRKFCQWRYLGRTDTDSDPCQWEYSISGWFRVVQGYSRAAAREGHFERVLPLRPASPMRRGNIRGSFEGMSKDWPRFEVSLSEQLPFTDSWFLASDVDKLAGRAVEPEPVIDGLPWGTHETVLLRHLASASDEWWSMYDPDDPATAPTNKQVATYLVNLGVAERIAEAMATILRADGLPSGRRPTK